MNGVISNTAQVKINNMELIKQSLKKLGQGSKIMVARETGLSVATCNSLLNELSASDEIIEFDDVSKKAGAGRPSKTYRINEQYVLGCCISLHIENRNKFIQYAVIDLLGHPLESNLLPKERIAYDTLKDLLHILLEKHPQIQVLSVGVPGVVDKHQTMESCDIEELSGINLSVEIKRDFGLDVIVENDMNLIAFGLYEEKHYKAPHSVVAISFIENICSGAGIIINGEIIRGRSNFAGEVSYLPMHPDNSNKRIKLPIARIENTEIIARTTCAFIAILNPDVIMLTGNSISITIMNALAASCRGIIPEQHMPELTYAQNTDSYYFSGLSQKAILHLNRKVNV